LGHCAERAPREQLFFEAYTKLLIVAVTVH
jgi:hypothetical protein